MGQKNDSPQAKDDDPLSNVSRGGHLWTTSETTNYQAHGRKSLAKGHAMMLKSCRR